MTSPEADRETIAAMSEWGPEGPEERRMRQTAQLEILAATTRQLQAAERLTDALRESRDRQVRALAQADRPLSDLATAAQMSVQGISKITRAAGLRRYRERGPALGGEALARAQLAQSRAARLPDIAPGTPDEPPADEYPFLTGAGLSAA